MVEDVEVSPPGREIGGIGNPGSCVDLDVSVVDVVLPPKGGPGSVSVNGGNGSSDGLGELIIGVELGVSVGVG